MQTFLVTLPAISWKPLAGMGPGSRDRPFPRVMCHPCPQARVERMEQFQKEKEELDRSCRECKRKVVECQRKLKELEVAEDEGSKVELERLQAEAQQLRKEERSWEQKLEEMRKKEKSMPWNVDTLSKDGFSKVCGGWRGTRTPGWVPWPLAGLGGVGKGCTG